MDAYEIRLEILKEAKDLILSQKNMEYGAKTQEYDARSNLVDATTYPTTTYPTTTYPTYEPVTLDDILDVAEKMNAFISNNSPIPTRKEKLKAELALVMEGNVTANGSNLKIT